MSSNLPPGVTNADIEAQVGDDTPMLSPGCEAILEARELFSQRTRHSAQLADIHGTDGERLFTVSRAISAYDLNAMLRYGEQMRQRGQEIGAESLRVSLRSLLGAAKEQ